MIHKKPLVSIITAIFNGQDTLEDCYQSVIGQTYKNFEWLMIDDQSTDSSFDMISNWKDSRICLWQTCTNTGGPAAPRNLAVEKSKGEFIAILDQDDIWDSDKLERQLDFMEKNKDIALLSCNMRVIGDRAHSVMRRREAIRKPGLLYPAADDIYRENPFLASTIIMRRFIFEDVGGFDERPEVCGRDEWELAIRISLKYRTAFNGDHIAGSYRLHRNNLSHTVSPLFGINYTGMNYIRNKHDHRFPDSLVKNVRARDCYNMARDALNSGEMDIFEEQISKAACYRSYYKWKGLFLRYKKYCKALVFMDNFDSSDK
ncbi:MAG: glycosyltransferase family A protein [Syntrophales bacterium]|uniref:glycosyltransferase family 2 protein n=1 Tax=Candidatus Wunengus sp. YC61 TaxID=3367698 RepID=UPI00271B2894|nr:glycosyltransferase family A protein [Syntrophales bacterium]